jgi:hypothetical protein
LSTEGVGDLDGMRLDSGKPVLHATGEKLDISRMIVETGNLAKTFAACAEKCLSAGNPNLF